MKTICVIGLWHLGLVNAVGFAEKGYKIIGLDFNKQQIKKLQNIVLPIYEFGLEEKIRKYTKTGNLTFAHTSNIVSKADYVIIAYDSLIDNNDHVNISQITRAVRKIAPFLNKQTPLIIISQIPLGTSEKIEALIKKIHNDWIGGVAYVPENLKLGTALERFLHPEMLVFGVNNSLTEKKVQDLYRVFQSKKFTLDLRSAEMVKHTLNAFLATTIAFGNEMAHLCDVIGVNAVAISSVLKSDSRVGNAPLFPGLGFSGGTLARDVEQLKKFAKEKKYKAHLLESITKINESTFEYVIHKLTKILGSLHHKKIGILGLTYKPGTSTLRRSPAIKLIKLLIKKNARCFAYDPKADNNEVKLYSTLLKRIESIEGLAKESDALILVTEWPEFKRNNYVKIAGYMKRPIMIDAKNYLDPQIMTDAGFLYEGYGQKK